MEPPASFEILTPHKELSLSATSLVEVRPRGHHDVSQTWAQLAVSVWSPSSSRVQPARP